MEERIQRMLPTLDERQKRLFLASEAISYGRGGISLVSRISGMSRTTITKAVSEIKNGASIDGKIRRSGGGRRTVEDKYPDIENKIQRIIDGKAYGDPTLVLSYTTESLRKIQLELEKYSVFAGYITIGKILDALGYSKQVNQRMPQSGKAYPDRNAQFEYINKIANEFLETGEPVIFVDTKKKEAIGKFKNPSSGHHLNGQARKVSDHDFPMNELGEIVPYGIHNVNNNVGFVNVGTGRDTSECAVQDISYWWEVVGRQNFPRARTLYLTCDCGGGNGNRVDMWNCQLQQFADRTRLQVQVSHVPSGTLKWNNVEHRLFCYITRNWQGKPLIDVQTTIDFIGAGRTRKGPEMVCVGDVTEYKPAEKVSDDDFVTTTIEKIAPFEAWNYRILPQ